VRGEPLFFATLTFALHSPMLSFGEAMGIGLNSGTGSEKQRENGALLIAASIVAAIRLRGQEVRPSPQLTAVIKDSVMLARLVLAELRR
jgi:hypothetical protein